MSTMSVGKQILLFLGLLQGCLAFDCATRKKWGYACESDCSQLYFCTQKRGVWVNNLVEDCGKKKCSESEGKCIESDFCSLVQPSDFECTSEGVFPNPFDCSQYYICGKESKGIKNTCLQSKGYSVITKNCSLDLTDHQCQYRPGCDRNLDSGPWQGDENIFYVCVQGSDSLKIELYRCPEGQIFRDGTCIDVPPSHSNAGADNNNSQELVKSPQDKQPDNNQISSNLVKPEAPCRRKGLMEHHLDCTKYVYCDHEFNKIEYSCPEKTYYDKFLRRCLRGTCKN